VILLDTHVLVWVAAEPRRLSRAAASAIRRAAVADGLGIASITLWELAFLFGRGRLRTHGTIEASIQRLLDATGVVVKEITPPVAALSMQFADDFPGDPADRLIAATARAEGLTLATADERMHASRLVKVVW
jgi:PIN domain nuclease of toxin-antitoxin system